MVNALWLDEFLIALGVKADTKELKGFEKGLDDVTDSAEKTEGALVKAYDATDGFVSAIEGALGVIGFFTGAIGGMWAMFHGTIMELEDLIKEEKLLTKITKDQIEQQKKYKESVETLGKRFTSLRVELAFGFLPTMQKMIDGLDDFLEKNKDVIVNGVMAFMKVLTSFAQIITNTVRFIDMIVESTIGWKKALVVLAVAFAWVKRAMILAFVTNPVVWIIAAIAGLLILIDDFMTYLDGGESEFGEFWEGMLKWVKIAKDKWNEFSDGAKGAIGTLALALGLIMPMFGGLTGFVMALGKAFIFVGKAMAMTPMGRVITLIGLIIYVIIDLIKWLNGGESQFTKLWETAANVWNLMVANAKSAIDSIKNFFGSGIDWIMDKFEKLSGFVSGITSKLTFGISGKMGNAVSNTQNRIVNNNITNNGNFNISEVASAKNTASQVNANWNQVTQNNLGGIVKA